MADRYEAIFRPAPGLRSPRPFSAGAPMPAAERARLGLTDRGRARRLAAAYPDAAVWCPEWGWGVWDGRRYDFTYGAVAVQDLAATLPELLREEADAAGEMEIPELEAEREIRADRGRPPAKRRGSADQAAARENIRAALRAALRADAEKCENVTLVERAVKALQPMMRCRLRDFDADPDYLALANGALRLDRARVPAPEAEDDDERIARRALFLADHDPAERPSRAAPVAYDPRAECPRFRAFIELIQPKPAMAAYLQRCCGLMLAGRNDYQVALLWTGSGANGKSTLLNILRMVLGELVANCPIEFFLHTQARPSSAATPDEADLPGARVYAAAEPEEGSTLSSARLKQFTGGEERRSRALYGKPFDWQVRGVPVISFNRMPKIKGDDEGTRRRLAFVPFEVNLRALPEGRQRREREVYDEMRAELPGILNWLIDGYAEAQAIGALHPPSEADILKEALLADADPIGEFVKACCVDDPAGRIGRKEFFELYEMWCAETGASLWAHRTVNRIMPQKGYGTVTPKGYVKWAGLSWATNEMTLDLLERLRRRKGGGDD